MSITTELYRLIFESLPACIIPLYSTFIFLEEGIAGRWKKILACGFAWGVLTWLTNLVMNSDVLRVFFNAVTLLLLLKYIFGIPWLSTLKYWVTDSLLIILAELPGSIFAANYWHLTTAQLMNFPPFFYKVMLPLYILTVPVAFVVRKLNARVKALFARIRPHQSDKRFRAMVIAVFIQLMVALSLMIQVTKDIGFINTYRILVTYTSFFIICGLTLYILHKTVNLTEQKMLDSAQAPISESITSLINTVRSQRHDFMNSLQVMNSLAFAEDYAGLKQYLSQLTGHVSIYNDILRINSPIIGALLNAKLVAAEARDIKVRVEVNADLSPYSGKAFDITRILGNLIDNAIEAVDELSGTDRWLAVKIQANGPLIVFTVTNPVTTMVEFTEKAFEPGSTTKGAAHSGLGLYICRQLAEKLHGTIRYSFDNEARFSLIIPKE